MFVLISEHLAPESERAAHHAEHLRWSEACFRSGHFLAAGPRVPHGGGITIARARSRDEIEALIDDDPYKRCGLTAYTIHEFSEAPPPHRWGGLNAFLGDELRDA